MCLDYIDRGFRANCYTGCQESNGEIEYYKGNIFYEIPPAYWYQFSEAIVMND